MRREGPYDILFEPVRIGPVTAPNRFYAVPHATGHGHSQPNGSIGLRAMKAEGGWGVISTQLTEIGPDSDMASHQNDRMWDETDIPVHARLVERVKAYGALVAVELGHGGMRARNMTTGLPVLGPSALPVIQPQIPVQARAMDKSDIAALRLAYRRAAKTAKQAGYDIVYVYAAHDLSILSHFLSRRTNQRSDEYGGSIENRVRLLREVIEDTKEAVGEHCAVAIRFAVEETGTELALSHEGEGRQVVEMLAELPDLWDVNISDWSANSATARFSEEGYQVDAISFVKQVTTKPVVGVGRFTSPDMMVSLIKRGVMDFIGAARPSIADPFLPSKIREGRIEDIRECIGCNICASSDSYGIPLRCTQNPTIAEEWRRGWHPERIPPCPRKHTVLVVGAGPAGLECGWTLARAGHEVTIAEASDLPGGRALRESRLAGLSTWRRVSDYRVYQLRQRANVSLHLNSPMAVDDIVEFAADHVVVASGAHWRRDGVGSTRFSPLRLDKSIPLFTPDDIMDGHTPKGPIVIYDDDHFYMGGVLAEHLSGQGVDVSLVTPHAEVSAWTGHTLEQALIVRRLVARGVQWHVNWSLDNIKDGRAVFKCAFTSEPIGSIGFSSLVLVGARTPNDTLLGQLRTRIEVERLWAIGDCLSPGTIQAAVFSGHRIARLLNGDNLAGSSFRREEARLFDD